MQNRSIGFTELLTTRKITIILLVLVFFGVLARLYHINAPLLDSNAFRQHDTAAIARNFYEGKMNIFYPQVDWRGNSPGYTEGEFPVYTFLVAVLYHIFGPHEGLGRAINIFFYALSATLLFRLTRRLLDGRTALFAVFFYSFVPLSLFYTRTFQPDALLALCSLAGVYYFWIWTEEDRWWLLGLSALSVCFAVLIKPPSLYLGLPLLYLCQHRFGWSLFRKPVLWFYAVVVFIPAILWYSHALHLWETYGNTFGILGIHTVMGHWPITDIRWQQLVKWILKRTIFEIATPPGLILLVTGFFTLHLKRFYLLHWWVVSFVIYILLVPIGHRGHDYYQLPIVFVTSVCMAYGTTLILDKKIVSRTVVAVLLLAVLGFSFWQSGHMFNIREMDRVTFGKRINQLTEPNELIIFVAPRILPDSNPTLKTLYRHRTAQGEYLYDDPIDFYLSHRKGWSIDEVQASPDFVETLRQRGAKYIATYFIERFERHPDLKTELERNHTPIEVTSKWAIYRLDDLSINHSSSGEKIGESVFFKRTE